MNDILWLIGAIAKVMYFVVSRPLVWFIQLQAAKPTAVPSAKAPKPVAQRSVAAQPVQSNPARADFADTIFVGGPIQREDFVAADRIVSIKLVPEVGVLNVRLFNTLKVAKRDLIVHEPRLRSLMKGRRHSLPDVPFDPRADLQEIKDAAVLAAERLINEVGGKNAQALIDRKNVLARKGGAKGKPALAAQPVAREMTQPMEPAVAKAVAPAAPEKVQRAQPAQIVVPNGANTKPANAGKVFSPRAQTGITYVGVLTEANNRRIEPKDRDAYEVFEAKLQLDHGAGMSLRGAELERELEQQGVKVGARVAITPMGKVPVPLANGSEVGKNLYRVERLSPQEKRA